MAGTRYQPQGAARLDRRNRLGAKVVECLPFNGQQLTTVSGRPIMQGSGAGKLAGQRGYYLRGVGSAPRANVPIDLSAYNKITISFWLNWDVYPGTDTALAMEFGPTYSSVNGLIVDPNNASPQAFMFGCGGSGGSNLVTFPRPSAGVWHRITLTFDRTAAVGASGQAYVDGVVQPMSAFPGSSATPGNFASSTLHLLSRNSASLFSTASIELLTIYNGILTPEEAADDARNPYQIFASPFEDDEGSQVSGGGSDTSLDGAAIAQASAAGALSTSISLAGTTAAFASAGSMLTTVIALSGAAIVQASASGVLAGGAAALAGGAIALASGTGALSTAIALEGTAVATASSAAALSTNVALTGVAFAAASASAALAGSGIQDPGKSIIDMSKIASDRIVVFDGSGSRVVVFDGSGNRVVIFEGSGSRVRIEQMSAKVPVKVGEKWTTDRDPDEISYYAADITQELIDRNTTADPVKVTPVLFGVELLEGPQLQMATIDGVQRTFVVVKLGPAEADLPPDWRWVARVNCMNGERFDKTTWFNKVDP